MGIRLNEARSLDLADIKWDLGRFGKLHVHKGKALGAAGHASEWMPLINNAGRTLRWFVEDVWGHFGDDHHGHGAPLFPSERKNTDGSATRISGEALRANLAEAAARHLPDWSDKLTPSAAALLRQPAGYLGGMDLIAIQQALGHIWVATTMQYIHVLHPRSVHHVTSCL